MLIDLNLKSYIGRKKLIRPEKKRQNKPALREIQQNLNCSFFPDPLGKLYMFLITDSYCMFCLFSVGKKQKESQQLCPVSKYFLGLT